MMVRGEADRGREALNWRSVVAWSIMMMMIVVIIIVMVCCDDDDEDGWTRSVRSQKGGQLWPSKFEVQVW